MKRKIHHKHYHRWPVRDHLNRLYRYGFTIIELLVVISIISLLASIVLVSLNNARSKARDAKRIAEVRVLAQALNVYYDKYSVYPQNEPDIATYYPGSLAGFPWLIRNDYSHLDSFVPALINEGILKQPIRDPLNNQGWFYFYLDAQKYSTDTGTNNPILALAGECGGMPAGVVIRYRLEDEKPHNNLPFCSGWPDAGAPHQYCVCMPSK